jgi:phage N-6-adenine-methyltransferase
MASPIIINPELRSLIPPLTAEEYAQLEANIVQDGCHDALIVWQEANTLLDGHHRMQICEQHGLGYRTQELSLPDLAAARSWMIRHQLGRRNLTPEQTSYFRGKQYDLQKKVSRGGGDRKSADAHDQKPQNEVFDTTAQELASQHKVSKATIERDANYARNIDTLAETIGSEVRQTLLARETKVTQQDVKTLAKIATTHAPVAKETLAAVQEAKTPKQAREIVQRAARETRDTDPPILTEVLDPEPPVDAASAWPRKVFTGDPEWYTPDAILVPVREVLGAIDLDPASCDVAQARVQARTYYTLADDGLRQPWHGTVFLNPPYKLPDVARFVGKLCEELDAHRTTEAILLVNSATETDWFQRAFARANAVCFPDGRVHFVSPTRNGDNPCQGQALFYFGEHIIRFCRGFAALGQVAGLALHVRPAHGQLTLADAPTLPLSLNAPAVATATDLWLARLLEQVNRLAVVVDLPLIAELAPAGDEALPLYADIVGMMDVVVTRLAAPPVVMEAPVRAKPRSRPAKGKHKAPLPRRVELAIAGKASFTCIEIQRDLGEPYAKAVWTVLDRFVKQGRLRKEGDTYVAVIGAPA